MGGIKPFLDSETACRFDEKLKAEAAPC